MKKETDRATAARIIRNGFQLPAEIEARFDKVKEKAVQHVISAREEGKKKLAELHHEVHMSGWSYDLSYKIAQARKAIPYADYPLEKAIEFAKEDVEYKRIKFIIKVNGITGDEITDAHLFIESDSGDVNGTVKGKNGTAKVQTILAGGYNIQCLHFRCLVREIA